MIRWFFIVSQCVWVVAVDALLPILLLMTLNLLVLRVQGFQLKYLWRSFKLLLWFFIPTILFQGLFTPGVMVQTPVYLPLSIEGLTRGFYLSMHIAMMFFAALAVFRTFSKQSWLHMMAASPLFALAMPYVQLLFTLKHEVKYILGSQKQRWQKQERKWSKLPDMLVDSIQMVIQASKSTALDLWQFWDERLSQPMEEQPMIVANNQLILYVSFLCLGWLVFWV